MASAGACTGRRASSGVWRSTAKSCRTFRCARLRPGGNSVDIGFDFEEKGLQFVRTHLANALQLAEQFHRVAMKDLAALLVAIRFPALQQKDQQRVAVFPLHTDLLAAMKHRTLY